MNSRIGLLSFLIGLNLISLSLVAMVDVSESQAEILPGASANGTISMVYEPTQKAPYETWRRKLESGRVFDQLVRSMNAAFKLPHSFAIRVKECGVVNAFYQPTTREITLCYELFEKLEQLFGKPERVRLDVWQDIYGMGWFLLLHEVGHALIDILNLPLLGNEEEVADYLATIMLIDADYARGSDDEIMAEVITSAMSGMWQLWKERRENPSPFLLSDRHPFEGQRFFRISCLAYGSDPKRWEFLLKEDWLYPVELKECASEFSKQYLRWVRILEPHVRVPFGKQGGGILRAYRNGKVLRPREEPGANR